MTKKIVIADYPDLTEESIRAVLGYAARALKPICLPEDVMGTDVL